MHSRRHRGHRLPSGLPHVPLAAEAQRPRGNKGRHPQAPVLGVAGRSHARAAGRRGAVDAEPPQPGGSPPAWHLGRVAHRQRQADEVAKQAAGWIDLPEHLMQQHLQHSSRAERAAGTVAAIQLRRFQARTRTEEGGAAEERRRVQPGVPWRLRARGAKRARPMAAEGQAPVAALQPLAAGDLLQMKPGSWPSPTAVRSAVQDAGLPVAGLHHLVLQGP